MLNRHFKINLIVLSELLAKVHNFPFDRLRVNGLRLKLFSFSVRGELVEPQKNTFARGSSVKAICRPFPSDRNIDAKFLKFFDYFFQTGNALNLL